MAALKEITSLRSSPGWKIWGGVPLEKLYDSPLHPGSTPYFWLVDESGVNITGLSFLFSDPLEVTNSFVGEIRKSNHQRQG